MTRGLYNYDPEVIESRWRLALASFRYLWRQHATLYLTGPYCVAIVADWSQCAACGPHVLALREKP